MDVRECRACKAKIHFARTESGKRIPLDVSPVKGFSVTMSDGPEPVAQYREVYLSHFATCPQADSFRRK